MAATAALLDQRGPQIKTARHGSCCGYGAGSSEARAHGRSSGRLRALAQGKAGTYGGGAGQRRLGRAARGKLDDGGRGLAGAAGHTARLRLGSGEWRGQVRAAAWRAVAQREKPELGDGASSTTAEKRRR